MRKKQENKEYKSLFARKVFLLIISVVILFNIGAIEASATVKVLSNSRHAYSIIRSTVTQLLGSGHLDTDVIVHSTYMDSSFTGSLSVALDSSKTFYDGAGNAVPSQAPYQIYTSSFTGYTGDTISIYNQFNGIDITHNYAFTKSTNSPPPVFFTAPGGDGWASRSGVEWTIDSSIFSTNSLSALTASNAGIMASIRHNHPTWNWFDVKAALRQTGTNWDTGYDNTTYGFGQINYASSTALTDNEILLQPPVATTTVSGINNQITFTLYPFKQTRRVKEVLFRFDSNPGFQANEFTLSDISALGGTKITERTDTSATSTSTPVYEAFSNKYFVWLTADNADDSVANFSRIDTYSILGPLSQSQVSFDNAFNISYPTDNAGTSAYPLFKWSTASSYFGVSKYQLFIDGVLNTDNITGTSTTITGSLSDGTHTWFVKAVNANGVATSSSSTRSISVLSGYVSSQTWYVDNVLGDDSNSGLQASPWKTIAKAVSVAQAGNSVVLIKNEGIPYREKIAPANGDTVSGNIIFRGVGVSSKPEVWGSEDISQYNGGGWTIYSGGNANTYKKSIVNVNVLFAGSSTSTITKRVWVSSANSLNAGEWYYAGSVLYYRLNAGEDINTLHIEAGRINYGLYCTARGTFKDIIVRYANTAGVFLGVGCVGDRLEIYDNGDHGATVGGSGTGENNLGAILKNSVIAGNYSYGINLSFAKYIRLYNNVVYDNSVGLHINFWAPNSIVKNNIFTNNTKNVQMNIFGAMTNFIASNNNWSSGTIDSNWQNTYKGNNNQASTTPLLKDASSRNFRLKKLSPNIDTGVSISGITTDILGNPIYGTPDIGAYEYQPPYKIGTDRINISGDTRLYADGKYRYTTATSTTDTADLTIRPKNGWGGGDYAEYLNISVSKWNKTGDYSKTWTEDSSYATTTAHTIGDLKANTYYTVKVDSSEYITAQTDGSGQLTFNYSGGYSSHTFNVDEDTTPPTSPVLSSPENNKKVSGLDIALSWSASTDSSGILKYQIYIDGALSVDNITNNSTSLSDSLPCGAHTWYVKSIDNAGNSANSSTSNMVMVCGGGIFTGSATTLPGYVAPRLQTIQPDGTVIYLDKQKEVSVKQAVKKTEEVKTELTPTKEAIKQIKNKEDKIINISKITKKNNSVVVTDIKQKELKTYPVFISNIAYGSNGSNVTQLQQTLRELGFFLYPQNTGYFGSVTEKAVKEFQKANGIEQVGIVGPKTRKALNNIKRTNKTTPQNTVASLQSEILRLRKLVNELVLQLQNIQKSI